MTQFDNSPGGLDGPPVVVEVEDKVEGRLEKIGRLLVQGTLVVFLIAFVAALIVGLVWGIAWMLTHFPTV